MKTQLAKSYQLNNYNHYYTISNKIGEDVFYYRKNSNFYGFPNQISVKTETFNDDYLNYCERKMNRWYLSEDELEFYIINYFNRLLKYKNKLTLYKIDDYLLNKNGRLSIVSLNFYKERLKTVFNNLDQYVKLNSPYSTNHNWWLFNFIKKQNIDFEKDYDFAELNRQDFEKELNNDKLRFEYVEHYHPQNKFYFEFIKNNDGFTIAKIVFYMTTNDEVKLFFLKSEYH